MSTIFQGFLYFGNKDEDSSENPFIWATLVSKSPKDENGMPVKNPGSIMVYGAQGMKPGDCGRFVLLGRGIAGLYNFVPQDKAEELLNELEMEISDVPEIPVAESTANRSTVSREEASKRAREARQARRGARGMTPASEPVAAGQPE